MYPVRPVSYTHLDVYKRQAAPFVGKLNFFKVYQGVLKGDSTLYNPNKEVEEKVSQLYTMQGKNQLPVGEVALGDIGVVAKLAQTATGDTLTTKDSGLLFDGIDFSEPTFKVAIAPKSKGDEDKLGNAITRLLEEDPTLRYEKNVETHQTTLTGLGEAHINIVIERLQRKFGVEVMVEMCIRDSNCTLNVENSTFDSVWCAVSLKAVNTLGNFDAETTEGCYAIQSFGRTEGETGDLNVNNYYNNYENYKAGEPDWDAIANPGAVPSNWEAKMGNTYGSLQELINAASGEEAVAVSYTHLSGNVALPIVFPRQPKMH